MADISDRVNVIDRRLVIVPSDDFSILGNFDANFLQTHIFCLGTSTDCEQNSVKDIFDLILTLPVSNNFPSFGIEFYFNRDSLLDELDSRFFHITSNFIGHVLIKTS